MHERDQGVMSTATASASASDAASASASVDAAPAVPPSAVQASPVAVSASVIANAEADADAASTDAAPAGPASGEPAQFNNGFLLTRHWRDTPAGTEVELWLATDTGPVCLRLPPHASVAFIPREQEAQARTVIGDEAGCELRPLALEDFSHRPVLGLYCSQYRTLSKLTRRLRDYGIDVYEADVKPPERYLMERSLRRLCRLRAYPRLAQQILSFRGQTHPSYARHRRRLPPCCSTPPSVPSKATGRACAWLRSTSKPPSGASSTASASKAAASERC